MAPSLENYRLQAEGGSRQLQVCNALRCSGPHARYTDEVSELITLAGRSG
jgi:hypothetical protein